MVSTEWGLFRLRGALSRKKFRARPVGLGQWAVTERTQTGKTMRGGEGDTCITQSLVPADEFLGHYIAVDAKAHQMVTAGQKAAPASHGSTALR